MFDVNVFGLGRMIAAILSGMRKRRCGFIVNLSSIGGLRSFPGLGYYNATKFAVEGLSEALWQEVEPPGIKVMVVEPSGFRTDWAGRSANESEQQLDDYAETAGARRSQIRAYSGKQPGYAVRAAQAVVRVVECTEPPHRLLLQRPVRSGDGQGRRIGRWVQPLGRGRARRRFPWREEKDFSPKARRHAAKLIFVQWWGRRK